MAIGIQILPTVIDEVAETKIIATSERGEFIGYVGLLYLARRSAGFRQLFVREDRRGLGIGRELVSRCAEIARNAGCETLGGLVVKDNLPAMAFYEKLGFTFAYEYDEGDVIVVKNLKDK